MRRPLPRCTLFPYTTLFRSRGFVLLVGADGKLRAEVAAGLSPEAVRDERFRGSVGAVRQALETGGPVVLSDVRADPRLGDRKSTRLNSSHLGSSYAVFCLKK